MCLESLIALGLSSVDLLGDILCGAEVDEVEYMGFLSYYHIIIQ